MSGVRENVMGGALFLNYPQSLGDEHSFSALISINVNASLVVVSAWLLLRTTAAGLISPLHIKIYPPSLWDNGYIWWAGVECERLSWGSLFLDYLQSLGDEHSFSALISITVKILLLSSPHGSCCEPPRRSSSHPCI